MASVKTIANQLTSGAWNGRIIQSEDILPGGGILDITQFTAVDAQKVVVGVAGAAQGATSVPLVSATVNDIPDGTVMKVAGSITKFIITNGDTPVGSTSLTVQALVTALVSLDTATYPGAGIDRVHCRGGRFVGRTYAQRDANAKFHPWIYGTDEEVYINAYDVNDLAREATFAPVLPSRDLVIYENWLPDWPNLVSGAKTLIRGLWTTSTSYN